MAKIEGKNGGTLTPWQPGQSGNPNGRPPNLLRRLEKAIGKDFKVRLSMRDKMQIIEAMLELTLSELKVIASNDNSPAFLVMTANAIEKDVQQGRMTTVESLADRVMGRPPQADAMGGDEDAKPDVIRIAINRSNVKPVTNEDDIIEPE
jgi:hypothetical protein